MRKSIRRFSALGLLASVCAILPRAEIIDRVAISIGNLVITEGQIEQEVRLTAFLNAEKVDPSEAEKKQAASRLIEQTLVRREMDFSRYPRPALSEADGSFKALKARYPSEAAYQEALTQNGISEGDLKERLLWQLTLLRFIDFRFRPGIQVSDADVQTYYQQQHPQPDTSLDEARPKIEEILTQQRIDESLDRWLVEARTQVPIRYHDEALR
jgi:hypothetical protein